MTKKESNSALRGPALLGLLVAGISLGWAYFGGHIFQGEENVEIAGAPVRRGPLVISVTERGNLTAKNSLKIKSEVEGRSTLLYLIEEGTQVEPGELLAEIDTSEHVDRQVAQEISVQTGRAAATKAREGLEIQRIENESLIAKAEQQVEFARLELEKFIGAELDGLEELTFEQVRELIEERRPSDAEVEGNFGGGNRQQELQESRDNILIREEERKRAQDRLSWSRQLAEKGFVERTELEADELAYTRAGIMLEQAGRALFLLEKYEHPKQWATLQGELREAARQLRKANKQAVAQLADYQAAKEATQVMFQLEEEKLARIKDQISKGKIHAPVSGLVVYGRTSGGRYSSSEPLQEGGEVYERQEIITIPAEGGMIAEASIHESAVKQVVVGLPVILRVDALPGREFRGEVTNVAVLPDKNSWWANPNLRLYKTLIVVEGGNADMRPGMSCSIEIMVDTIADTLYVPVQAVHHSGGKTIAWVRKDGNIAEREVKIGLHNQTWLEITSGLAESEVVLLSPPIGFQAEEVHEDGSTAEDELPEPRGGDRVRPEGGAPEGRPTGAGRPGSGEGGGGSRPTGAGRPGSGEGGGGSRPAGAGRPGGGEGGGGSRHAGERSHQE